jgi:hypothetical protein
MRLASARCFWTSRAGILNACWSVWDESFGQMKTMRPIGRSGRTAGNEVPALSGKTAGFGLAFSPTFPPWHFPLPELLLPTAISNHRCSTFMHPAVDPAVYCRPVQHGYKHITNRTQRASRWRSIQVMSRARAFVWILDCMGRRKRGVGMEWQALPYAGTIEI